MSGASGDRSPSRPLDARPIRPRPRGFSAICAMLAARSLRDSGVRVEEIARQVGRSPVTVRSWIRKTEAR